MPLEQFGDYVLLTNFHYYVNAFAAKFNCDICGVGRPMQAATNSDGLSIVNFGIGSANAATVMDLLSARHPKGVLFLGKCGGLKTSTEIGHFILPIAAIRGDGTSDDYFPREVPALPSFKVHKFVSEKIVARNLDYRTGVIYTTNRRLWEHDTEFLTRLQRMTCIGIDMETATVFIVGHHNEIARGCPASRFRYSVLPRRGENRRVRSRSNAGLVGYSPRHWHRGYDANWHQRRKDQTLPLLNFSVLPPGLR